MDDRTPNRRLRSAILAMLALLLALPTFSGHASPPVPRTACDVGKDGTGNDTGDTMATATELVIPTTCRGTLTAGTDDADWYAFIATTGREISFDILAEPGLHFLGVKIIDSKGKLVLRDDGETPLCNDSSTRDQCAPAILAENDTYFLVLTREVGAGGYEIHAEGSSPQADCGQPGDAGGDPLASTEALRPRPIKIYSDPANPKVRRIVCEGAFEQLQGAGDFEDGYSFFIPIGTIINIEMAGHSNLTQVTSVALIGPDNRDMIDDQKCLRVLNITTWGGYTCKPDLVSGNYTVRLTHSNLTKNRERRDYAVTLTLTQDDCGDLAIFGENGDAPDTSATSADRRALAGRCIGDLDGEPTEATGPPVALDPVDQFAVATDPATLSFQLVPPNSNCVTLRLLPPGGTVSNDTVCGPTVLNKTRTGTATGFWEVDVIYAGLAPGETSSKGGRYIIDVTGMVAFHADCGTPADVVELELALPPRIDDGTFVPTREIGCAGDLRTVSDTDTYLLPGIAHTDVVQVDLGLLDTPRVCLIDAAGTNRGCGNSVSARADTAAQAGTWKARVEAAPAPLATYTVAVTAISQQDCGDHDPDPEAVLFVDAGNTDATATPLGQLTTAADALLGNAPAELQACGQNAAPVRLNGQLRHRTQDNADWYSVVVTNQFTALSVAMMQEAPGDPRTAADFDLIVVRPDGTRVTSARPPGVAESLVVAPNCPTPQGVTIPTCAGAGTWKIGVVHAAGPLGAYRLAIAGRN